MVILVFDAAALPTGKNKAKQIKIEQHKHNKRKIARKSNRKHSCYFQFNSIVKSNTNIQKQSELFISIPHALHEIAKFSV